ncbi:tubulin epsilon and delta complex protein 2 isoform X2 [Larimichthys crocea]|uniref:tubulin epsilon and delta complex protein 2 isoform X2 n=1 Tax=Larimichthys crocea TaxID=215358 RepID=UPI000F5E2584|nr:tubulin epsilon and delta complex protein 2 isoform X2 [Larimichthys crocea]
MSLLSVVEQAIKSCKAEQARIKDSIQLYREILHTVTPQPNTDCVESDSADDATAADTDVSPGEKEDIELLEQALEKALWVRTGTGPSKKGSNKQCAPRKETKEGMQAFAASKGNQTTTRSTSKSASLARKEQKRPAGIVHHQPARKSQQAVSASGCVDPGQLHTSAFHSKNKTNRGNVLSGNDLGRAAAISMPSSNNTAPVSHTAESGAPCLPQQNGTASDQTAQWRSLRRKQNRLWDKVAASQRKPVPGRSHFMERIRATFPKDWPCGSPDQTRALVDRLTHQGYDLIQHCQTQELVAKQTPETATEPGGKTLERWQMTAAELQNFAGQVKQEWEAWDRWRPEGGCLCPTRANSVWSNGMVAPLPPTVTYTTEAELRELEKLRMRVALLQQKMHLEQALLDTLSPQLSSIVPGPGCPDVSVLRDVYSLLGEGGQRFPAIVLDSEPD